MGAGRVVCLTGPVGAGKTTVAKELVKLMPEPVAYLEGDVFWSFLVKPGGKGGQEGFRAVLRAMFGAAAQMARSGYDVVLDFSVPPAFLPVAGKILKDVRLDLVMLRPGLAVCELRAAARAEGRIGDYGGYRDFYGMFVDKRFPPVAGDEEAAEEVAARIFEWLAGELFRVAGG
jgi:chloramphenicol 3-O-phosphotransferase